jgi:hypothetical protein
MAQWLGQFSGHTHATRVEDAEASLRRAVEAFRAAGSSLDRVERAKAVHRLAKGLLRARLKLAKARLAAATDAQAGVVLARRAQEIAALERKYALLREAGLVAILDEFGARDALIP